MSFAFAFVCVWVVGKGVLKAWLMRCSYEKSLKEDVEILRHSPFFTGMQIYGLLQDTESGLLEMKFDPSNAV